MTIHENPDGCHRLAKEQSEGKEAEKIVKKKVKIG
jgi:hypothetical protein